MRIAVDIGGTFTDVALFDETQGTVTPGKALSTPSDLVDGIMSAMGRTTDSPATIDLMIHGSTVVINSIIQRQGPRPPSSPPRVSATFTRSDASTVPSPSTSSSANTAPSSLAT